jgi:hypothetical protein
MVRPILLTRNLYALVDDEDYDRINRHPWYLKRARDNMHYYAETYLGKDENGKDIRTTMHQMVMNAPPGTLIDHEDGNQFNNTRGNLRFSNHSENAKNVRANHKRKPAGVRGRIDEQGRHRFLGYVKSNGVFYTTDDYDTWEEAKKAQLALARSLRNKD